MSQTIMSRFANEAIGPPRAASAATCTWLDGVGERAHDNLPRCLHCHAGLFTRRSPTWGHLLPIDAASRDETLDQEGHATSTVHVDSHIASARLEVGEQWCAPADGI